MSVSLFSDSYTQKPANERLDIRFVGAVSGCYRLASRAGNEDRREVFACRSQSISTTGIVLSAPVQGEVGEKLTIKLEEFNLISGTIARLFPGGFAMDFTVTEKERADIAAKIDWIKKRRFQSLKDKRGQKRVIPTNPRSTITLPDASIKECFVIDVSRSGVAVSADVAPEIGTRAAIGRAIGTVVRHVDTGFAVQFDEMLDLDAMDKVFAWLGDDTHEAEERAGRGTDETSGTA